MIFVACMQVLCTDECNCSWLHSYITLLPFQELIRPLHLGSWFGKYDILQFGLYYIHIDEEINELMWDEAADFGAAGFEHIGMFGDRAGGEEREQPCRLAANMRPSA